MVQFAQGYSSNIFLKNPEIQEELVSFTDLLGNLYKAACKLLSKWFLSYNFQPIVLYYTGIIHIWNVSKNVTVIIPLSSFAR